MRQDDEYLEAQVLTASPHRLHLLVVDAAIRFAGRATEALRGRDFEAAHFALNDARDFVAELIRGLDESQAPDLVRQLSRMFAFVYRRLVDADLHRSEEFAEDALKILRMHRETWWQLGETIAAVPGERPDSVEPGGRGLSLTG